MINFYVITEIIESNLLRIFKTLLVVFISSIVCLSAPATMSFAQEGDVRERITVEGEGEAVILDEDLSEARKMALDKAFQNAFENALYEVLPLGLPPEADPEIFNELVAMKKKFLLRYRILSEMPALEEFFITIQVTFSVPMILQELAAKGIMQESKKITEFIKINIYFSGVSVFEWYQHLMHLFRQELDHVKTVGLVEVLETSMVLHVEYEGELLDFMNAMADLQFNEFKLEVSEGRNEAFKDDEDSRDKSRLDEIRARIKIEKEPVEAASYAEEPQEVEPKAEEIKNDEIKDEESKDEEIKRTDIKEYNVSISILPLDGWMESAPASPTDSPFKDTPSRGIW